MRTKEQNLIGILYSLLLSTNIVAYYYTLNIHIINIVYFSIVYILASILLLASITQLISTDVYSSNKNVTFFRVFAWAALFFDTYIAYEYIHDYLLSALLIVTILIFTIVKIFKE